MTISRRDFLNGMALTIAAGLTPADQLLAQTALYPPALKGMRGQHPGSFDVAHALARNGQTFDIAGTPVSESYDLVVVGGGISGLAAAWFYRKAAGPDARILILDNHDDFGGHAKRNEFKVGGRTLIGYGGSESMEDPEARYGQTAMGLLNELGVELERFDAAFDREIYPSLGLTRATFFARETFGRDVLVNGEAPWEASGPMRQPEGRGKTIEELVAEYPISDESKEQYLALYDATRDPLAGRSAAEKRELLESTSYRDFLINFCGCGEEVANCFQGRTLGFLGLGADAVAAADGYDLGLPGFAGLDLAEYARAEASEPYIYHFPDGNASLVRLLVRGLIPGAAPGATMEDVVRAPFDYTRLDSEDANVRLRLNATCVGVSNTGDTVSVGYVQGRTLHHVEAKHTVLACWHMMIPFLMPELDIDQRAALRQNVKTPIVYTNVAVRDWQPWVRLGVHDITAPMSFHTRAKLDFPVSLGGYRNPADPSQPMLLHLTHVPAEPNRGLDARAQFHAGQEKLYRMSFADFEGRIRDELDRMLGGGGFVSARDIAAITVNRWPHGYSYSANALFDADDYNRTVLPLARRTVGRVAIANSDSGGDAYVHIAINQAARAVSELVG
jgi:spermidine dehydrogenase